ncbi:MAG: LysR family transcriptional regulator [Pseudomonas sp.]|jgi:DNA-binding transcriptional LysR family regulator|uniref:LysR family transcriptional regulator n=1 Tax=Pseudomonas sp. TaxID=306 RepID=UPI00260E43D8|nr:LysR family transcriptional regulator [Pseudomonas sp.]MDB6051308.1 LysR family transcriptional regulator [Pseudomonas sp.]
MTLPARLFWGQISDFDLKLVRTFRAVADCNGFSLAEIELNMTKSAISKQIADLEIRLGVQLCHRGRSGFSLTAEGQLVYDASGKMFSALEGFRTELNALQTHPAGTLHIGSIDTLITSRKSLIMEILTRFSTDFPEVKIKMITTSSAEIDQCVADRRMQVGFSTDRGIIKGAKSLPLFSEHSYLYCGKNHFLFDRDESDITLELLNDQRFAQHAYSEAELRNENRIGFTPAASGQFSEGIAMLILTGNFIGFLPQHYAISWVAAGEMRPLLPANIRKVSKIRLLYHDDGVVMPLVAAFVKTAETIRQEEHDVGT